MISFLCVWASGTGLLGSRELMSNTIQIGIKGRFSFPLLMFKPLTPEGRSGA